MSEENKNLFVELPEDATEKNQKEWQSAIDDWADCDEPFVCRPTRLDKIQKGNAYLDGVQDYAKAMVICGGIWWGITKLIKHFNNKKNI